MTATERDRLIVVEGKIDSLIDKMEDFIATSKECHIDHEKRIRALEGKPGKMWGVFTAAIITGVVGAVIGALFAVFVR